jgi:hypothetical protein
MRHQRAVVRDITQVIGFWREKKRMSRAAGLDHWSGLHRRHQYDYVCVREKLKQVSVPILDDGIKEPKESSRVTLSNSTGGAMLVARLRPLANDDGVFYGIL